MPDSTEISGSKQIGQRCPFISLPPSCPRTSWLVMAQIAPVVIPALSPSLDRSLKEDRSLCPVRMLHYYLDKTQELRQNKELLFVSFKKGFSKEISRATLSSWIKQTVIPCYQLSDQKSLDLHQVKAHDVRAFAASIAFHGGSFRPNPVGLSLEVA